MAKRKNEALENYQKWLEQIADATGPDPLETPKQKEERIKRARKDYTFMVNYYFPHYASAESADFHIAANRRMKRNKILIEWRKWGRGLAKSVQANVLDPFSLFIEDEPPFLVIIGENETKAKLLLADIQAEFEANARIIADFGEQKVHGHWEDGKFMTKSRFIGMAIGMGQEVRGLRVREKRPTHIVVDDIENKQTIKNPKRQREIAEWIETSLLGTMDGPIRRLIMANNRFAPSMVHTILIDKHPKWRVDRVDAFDPVTYKPRWYQKYSPDYYRELVENPETGIGTLAANAEYNNDPHIEGKIFTSNLIQWKKLPQLRSMKHIVGFWDVAYAGTTTADYNAVRVWGVKDRSFFLCDCFVKQTKMKPAVRWMADKQKSLPENVVIHWHFEAQFWNDEVKRIIREVEKEYGITLNIIKVQVPKTKKYDRILELHPYYQNSRIYYNEKLKGHNDTQVGLAQLKGIEPGYKTNDDAPDADREAIRILDKYVIDNSERRSRMGARSRSSRTR